MILLPDGWVVLQDQAQGGHEMGLAAAERAVDKVPAASLVPLHRALEPLHKVFQLLSDPGRDHIVPHVLRQHVGIVELADVDHAFGHFVRQVQDVANQEILGHTVSS